MNPPLAPDEGEARDLLVRELSKPEYTQARPSPLDQFINGIWRWFASLFQDHHSGGFTVHPTVILLIVGLILGVLLVVFFGRPRAVARRHAEKAAVFLENDSRTVAQLRAASEAAAERGNWSLAVTERYRAIARALTDRTLIRLRPGTTAQAVSNQAARVFPEQREALVHAADAFDQVRYAGTPAEATTYLELRELDAQLERTKPSALPAAQARDASELRR